jgi:flagellar biosynthesis/type III secretory pathway chaperone
MTTAADLTNDLRQHQAICQELLAIVEREAMALRSSEGSASAEFLQGKNNLLLRLNRSVDQLRFQRENWQRWSQEERALHPQIAPLLQLNQDLIMKILMLDRENEQALLRKGLVPAHQLPSANRHRPHFVADLYRRHGRS